VRLKKFAPQRKLSFSTQSAQSGRSTGRQRLLSAQQETPAPLGETAFHLSVNQ
jgi:hypothetical protein